jgi:hypothetical protein
MNEPELGNGLATADDFRRAAENQAFEEPRRIVLPHSGMAVMLRRPRPIAFTLTQYGLPATLSLKIQGISPVSEMTDEERRDVSLMWLELFGKMFHKPGLSLRPGPDQINPGWIPDQDKAFLIRWAVGEVDDQNVSLAQFRGEREPVGAGALGEAVGLPSVDPSVG